MQCCDIEVDTSLKGRKQFIDKMAKVVVQFYLVQWLWPGDKTYVHILWFVAYFNWEIQDH